MSRSYRKSPLVTRIEKTTNYKRLASKKARKIDDLPSGGAYRKVYESANIREFISRQSLGDLLKAYESDPELRKIFGSEDELRAYWKKKWIRK